MFHTCPKFQGHYLAIFANNEPFETNVTSIFDKSFVFEDLSIEISPFATSGKILPL